MKAPHRPSSRAAEVKRPVVLLDGEPPSPGETERAGAQADELIICPPQQEQKRTFCVL
jgi:hypothetical protein